MQQKLHLEWYDLLLNNMQVKMFSELMKFKLNFEEIFNMQKLMLH